MALLLTAALSASGCAAGGPSPCETTPVTRSGQVPTVRASPDTTGVAGVLLDGRLPVVGRPSRIRWLVDARRAAPELTIIAGRQDVNQSFQQRAGRTQSTGSLAEFDSSLDFPAAGCWNVNVQTGPVDATVTFDVKKA